MPGRQLTQAGLNRVMFAMLRALGGKFTISEREVENVTPEDAMKIQYDPSVQNFAFTLHKVKDAPSISKILTPGMN